jgi:hypothetical protein
LSAAPGRLAQLGDATRQLLLRQTKERSRFESGGSNVYELGLNSGHGLDQHIAFVVSMQPGAHLEHPSEQPR